MSISKIFGHCSGNKCFDFIKNQLEYIFGDGTGHSLVVGGPGPNPIQNPHHAGSFCKPYPATCGFGAAYDDQNVKNHFTLFGALVGGPKSEVYHFHNNCFCR